MAKDPDISGRMDRVEEIIEQLDTDEVSLDEGQELHGEGQQLLTEIRDLLHDSEGEIIEIE
ncbi:MAG: exodeoxyribonuclease VII small subunit [Halobacteriaceae archaeon]